MIDDAELIKISLLFNIYEFRCWRDENPQDFLSFFFWGIDDTEPI